MAAGRANPDYHPSRALLALTDMKPRGKGELAFLVCTKLNIWTTADDLHCLRPLEHPNRPAVRRAVTLFSTLRPSRVDSRVWSARANRKAGATLTRTPFGNNSAMGFNRRRSKPCGRPRLTLRPQARRATNAGQILGHLAAGNARGHSSRLASPEEMNGRAFGSQGPSTLAQTHRLGP